MDPSQDLDELSPSHQGTAFDAARRITPAGDEYWTARELMPLLGYLHWRNFTTAIRKAITTIAELGVPVDNHFDAVVNEITAGKGARGEQEDYWLSRYACYLIAMNGNPRISQVAEAQLYFAVQTRRQELQDQRDRLAFRARVKETHKALHAAAHDAGVIRFGIFNDAGCRGLYGDIGVRALNELRMLPEDANRFDFMGKVELAANDLNAAQTEDRLRRNGVQSEQGACEVFYKSGKALRQALIESGTPPPEDLPVAPDIKSLTSRQPKRCKPPLITTSG